MLTSSEEVWLITELASEIVFNAGSSSVLIMVAIEGLVVPDRRAIAFFFSLLGRDQTAEHI